MYSVDSKCTHRTNECNVVLFDSQITCAISVLLGGFSLFINLLAIIYTILPDCWKRAVCVSIGTMARNGCPFIAYAVTRVGCILFGMWVWALWASQGMRSERHLSTRGHSLAHKVVRISHFRGSTTNRNTILHLVLKVAVSSTQTIVPCSTHLSLSYDKLNYNDSNANYRRMRPKRAKHTPTAACSMRDSLRFACYLFA